MKYSRIAGTGSYLPERVVTNAEIAKRVDTSNEWIVARTGIESRHVAAEGQLTSELALHASRRAMEAAGVTAADIDLIVLATTTGDMQLPSTAALLQAKLGVPVGAAVLDVQAVCTGFMYAITVADAMITKGLFKCALVIGAETLTRFLNWDDRNSCILFGDGAGAAILKPSDEPGLLSSHLHADGNQSQILRLTGTFAGGKISNNPFVELDGQAVYKFAVRVLEDCAREALAHNGLRIDQLDWLVPHQANLRIITAAAERLGMPMERVVTTVQKHGNTSAASAILALDEAVRDGRIKAGQLVLLQGVGGGMTWGSVLVRWG
jgi:3-oxoacyl-[acyl-carrier-protein] synthase III